MTPRTRYTGLRQDDCNAHGRPGGEWAALALDRAGELTAQVGEKDAELSLVHPLFHSNTADTKDILFLSDTYWWVGETPCGRRGEGG